MKSFPDIFFEIMTATGHFISDTHIGAGASGRCYLNNPPNGFKNENKILVFSYSEKDQTSDSILIVDVDVRCYGGSNDPNDARTVYDEARDRLLKVRGEVVTSGTMQRAWFQTGQSIGLEDKTNFPVWLGVFRVHIPE